MTNSCHTVAALRDHRPAVSCQLRFLLNPDLPPKLPAALLFAQERLGPASHAWLESGPGAANLQKRLAAGAKPEDAALGAIFEQLRGNRAISEEFIGHFLKRVLGIRLVELYPGLRRMLDTGDLAQSVMADLVPAIPDLKFTTESAFLSYLVQRMRWKATDRVRSPRARTERATSDPDAILPDAITPETGDALRGMIAEEERAALLITIHRLPERERTLLLRYLEGADSAQVSAELGLTPEAYRKALQRAIARARELLQ